MAEDKGLRHNAGKLRYDLIEPYAIEEFVDILTKGAAKYEDHNWEKGMKWSKVLASAKRHSAEFEKGQDYDVDPNCKECQEDNCIVHTGKLHVAQAAWNYLALTSYYKVYPEGDDRQHGYLKAKRIALDIDEVICDWVTAWCEKYNLAIPKSWYFQYEMMDEFQRLTKINELDDFYFNLNPKEGALEMPFEPVCYISHRPVGKEITEKWLQKHGFPLKPVHIVTSRQDKVQVCKDNKIDIFIDDSFDTFVEMNKQGVCCFLYDAPHNRRYDVGYKRIYSLKELTW